MKKNYLFLFTIGLIFLSGCTKKDTEFRLSEFATPTITGVNLRGFEGSLYGTMGVPNVKLGNESNDSNSDYYFTFYPNPSAERIFIYIETPDNEELKKLWIVQANWDNQIPQDWIGLNNANNMTVGGSPLFQAEFTANSFGINLSQFTEGFYRIYLKVNEHLLYDNLVIYKSKEFR